MGAAHGQWPSSGDLCDGGALRIVSGSHVKINKTLFENNSAILDGAISVLDAELSMKDCKVRYNSAGEGGALRVNSSPANIEHCSFTQNDAIQAGTIEAINGTVLTMYNNIFINNSASKCAGAIGVFDASSVLMMCVFVENRATLYGGALMATTNKTVEIKACIFDRNVAGTLTSAILLGGKAVLNMQNSSVTNNECTSCTVSIDTGSSGIISSVNFTNNTSSNIGIVRAHMD